MGLFSFVWRQRGGSRRNSGTFKRRGFRPVLEGLENRLAPALLTVTSIGDDVTADDQLTLREAILAANVNADADTIVFGGSGFTDATPDTINLDTALPEVTSALTITGPAAASLTLQRSGTDSYSLLEINTTATVAVSDLIFRGSALPGRALVSVTNATASFSQCTFRDNQALFAGGIRQNGGSLTVTQGTFTNNTVQGGSSGGGISFNGFGTETLTVVDSVFTNNTAEGGGAGGAIRSSGSVTVTGSTFLNNKGTGGGAGGAISATAFLTLSNSVLAGNSAGGTGAGAVFLFQGGALTNCTIDGNRSLRDGGGVIVYINQTATLTHCTITGNIADAGDEVTPPSGFGAGGGLLMYSGGTATVRNSIIAGNFDTPNNAGPQTNPVGAHPDVSGTVIDAGGNLIGSAAGATGFTVSTLLGTLASPLDPLLGPLADHGGPTATRALLIGSPARDGGSNALIPAGVTTDQRGAGFPRIANGTVDIGAYEAPSIVTLTASDTTADELPSGDAGEFTLTRSGDVSAPLTVTIAITGTAGVSTDYVLGFAQGTSAFGVSGNTVTLTFAAGSATATFGLFVLGDLHAEDDETAILTLNVSTSYDVGSPASGTVTIERNDFLVINTNDSGEGSFAQAVANANYFATADTITFDTAGVFATPQTITVAGNLSFEDTALTTVQGPGQARLTLDGSLGSSTSFLSSDTSAALKLVDLTLANGAGRAVVGGAGSALTLDRVTLRNNQSSAVQSSGTLTVTASTFRDNVATGKDGAAIEVVQGTATITDSSFLNNTVTTGKGGAIVTRLGSAVSIRGSTFDGNRTIGGDGGAVSNAGTLQVRDTLFVGNQAGGGSGGALFSGGPPSQVVNSTFSGNSADVFGGGLFNTSTLTVINSTITGNRAPTGGGIMTSAFAPITLHNTIAAGNTNGTPTPSDLGGNPGAYASASSNNLIGTGGNGILTQGVNGNQVGIADPLLGPLADNGGLTRTHALLSGSPARNAGSNAVVPGDVTTDQRGPGFSRFLGIVDIGAFEAQTNPNQPPVLGSQSFSVAENAVNGTSVGTVAASDPDGGQTLTYAILGGNTGDAFAINPTTGEITVANRAALDFETTPSFNLTVQVTDNGTPPLTAATTVTITLLNLDEAVPTALAALTNVTSAGGTSYTFTVTFSDDVALDVCTLDDTDIRVTGPNGFNQLAELVSINNLSNGPIRIATYRIIPPSGAWTAAANGSWSVVMEANQVADTAGKFVAAGSLGSFTVSINTGEIEDVTARVGLTRGGFRYNRVDQLWWQTITITNKSAAPIQGTIQLVLNDLPAGVTLQASPEHTVTSNGAGRYTVTIPRTRLSMLGAGQRYSITLGFANPNLATMSYTWQVFSNPTIP